MSKKIFSIVLFLSVVSIHTHSLEWVCEKLGLQSTPTLFTYDLLDSNGQRMGSITQRANNYEMLDCNNTKIAQIVMIPAADYLTTGNARYIFYYKNTWKEIVEFILTHATPESAAEFGNYEIKPISDYTK